MKKIFSIIYCAVTISTVGNAINDEWEHFYYNSNSRSYLCLHEASLQVANSATPDANNLIMFDIDEEPPARNFQHLLEAFLHVTNVADQSEQSLAYGMIQSTLHLHVPSLLYLAARNRAEASNVREFSIETLPYDAIKKYVEDVKNVINTGEIDCPHEVFYKLCRAKDISNAATTAYYSKTMRSHINSSDHPQTRKMLITHGASFYPEYKGLKDIRHDIPDSPIDALNTIQRGDISPEDTLIKAACLEHPETINAIIARYTISLHDKHVALHAAVDHNSLQCCQAILTHMEKIDFNQPLYGAGNHNHFLTSATFYGFSDIVKLFLDNGADVSVCDDESLTLASENGDLKTVKLLLDHGADIHAQNEKALEFPCLREPDSKETRNAKKASIIRLLLAYGANMNTLNTRDQEEYHQLLAEYPEEPGKNTASSSQ